MPSNAKASQPDERDAVRSRCRLLLPVAAICALLGIAIASAHARYDHSTPGQGEVVQTSPPRVDIYTVQEMAKQQGAYAIMVERNGNGTTGQRVDTANTVIDDANRKHFSVGLQPNLPPGRYVVSFKNVSDEDGEADHGQYAFYVGTGPTAAQKALDAKLQITAKSETTSTSHTGLIIGIVVAIAVLVLLAGGGLWYARRPRRRI